MVNEIIQSLFERWNLPDSQLNWCIEYEAHWTPSASRCIPPAEVASALVARELGQPVAERFAVESVASTAFWMAVPVAHIRSVADSFVVAANGLIVVEGDSSRKSRGYCNRMNNEYRLRLILSRISQLTKAKLWRKIFWFELGSNIVTLSDETEARRQTMILTTGPFRSC